MDGARKEEVVSDPKIPMVYVDGLPIPTGRKPVTGKEIVESLVWALNTEYTGKDPKKLGLTKYQAMWLSAMESAQEGDLAAINVCLDRLIGKPIQQLQNLNVSASLSEFLDELNHGSRGGKASGISLNARTEEPVDPLSD